MVELFSRPWVALPVGMEFSFIMTAPLLPSCCGFSFVLGCGVSFFGRFLFIQQLVGILVFSQE